ncbi:unnamed protein product [Diamesa serratosioi]
MAEAKSNKVKGEEIFSEFQNLRNQQRNLVNNLSTLELDLKEHKTVIDTLKTVDEDRKCFRLIGGVLVEQKVVSVLPQLVENKNQLEKLIENGKEQLTKKGIEINEFKKEYNIQVKSTEETISKADEKSTASPGAKSTVLVS